MKKVLFLLILFVAAAVYLLKEFKKDVDKEVAVSVKNIEQIIEKDSTSYFNPEAKLIGDIRDDKGMPRSDKNQINDLIKKALRRRN